VHAPIEDKSDNTKDNFYEELEHVINQFSRHHMKILLGYFNMKIGRKDIFKPTTRNESLNQIINDNGVRVVNFATSKNLSRVQCSHITTFINTLGLHMKGRQTHNQTDHILIDKRWHSSIADVQLFIGRLLVSK
jgi:hypothetical protein